MLRQTTVFAELRQQSQAAVGTARLDGRVDFPAVVDLYQSQIVMVSKAHFTLDLPVDTVHQARISDVERLYSRFVRQFVAYWELHSAKVDPSWTCITGYYCAFFGAQTVLTMLGRYGRGLPATGILPAALYSIEEQPAPYAGLISLVFRKKGASSHAFLWTQTSRLMSELAMTVAANPDASATLDGVRQLVDGPPRLNEYRNALNYSLDVDPSATPPWPTEIGSCVDTNWLEARLRSGPPIHAPQRCERLMLGFGSLIRAMYESYLARAPSADKRPMNRRRSIVCGTRFGGTHPGIKWT